MNCDTCFFLYQYRLPVIFLHDFFIKISLNIPPPYVTGLKPTTASEEMDFRSEIIFEDEMHDFSSFKTKDISDQISNKLESIVLGENKSKKKNKGNKSLSKLPQPKAEKKLTSSKNLGLIINLQIMHDSTCN